MPATSNRVCNHCGASEGAVAFDRTSKRCKPCNAAMTRLSRAKHRAKYADYKKKWIAENRDQNNGRQRARYAANAEHWRTYQREWGRNNKDKKRPSWHRRRARVRAAAGSFSVADWSELLRFYGGRCLACGVNGDLVPDHVTPLSKGGTNFIWNIQPLCVACNRDKWVDDDDYRPMWGLA